MSHLQRSNIIPTKLLGLIFLPQPSPPQKNTMLDSAKIIGGNEMYINNTK